MSNNQTTAIANLCAIDEQLFTEVTPEQAAIVEGGLRVQLTQVECLQAGADFDGSDEVFVAYNGIDAGALNGPEFNFGRPANMSTGSIRSGFLSLGGSSGSSATSVSLLDKDGSNRANADFIGSFSVTSTGFRQSREVGFSGGSRYKVTFNAFQ